METIYNKTRKFDRIAVTVFTLLFMTVGFLQLCSFTFGNKIISVFQWPTVALGILILAERFITFKYYKKTRGILFLVLFAVGYVISSLITFSYGWYENVRFLIFMMFQFGLLYATDENESIQKSKLRIKIVANYFLIVIGIMSVASFVTMITNYNKSFSAVMDEALPAYYIGFWYGRLHGVYWDPNIAAVTAAVAIILSWYFLINSKKIILKVINIFNILLQFFYIVFSGSRTGIVALAAGAVIFNILLAIKKGLCKNKIKNIVAIILVGTITFCVTYFGPKVIKSAVNEISKLTASQQSGQQNHQNSNNSEESNSDTTIEQEIDIFDRGYDLSTDISNQRFAIWKSAFEIFKESPVFGVSRANILPFAQKNLPTTYIINNYYMNFDSMHNAYIEILTSCGIVGIALFMSFMIHVISGVIINLKKIFKSNEFYLIATIIGICTILSICSLFIAEMVFVISPASTLLWVSLGYMNQFINKIKNGSGCSENT